MTNDEIQNTIINIIFDVLEETQDMVHREYITPCKHITSDLGGDSLDRLDIMVRVEKAFPIAFPEDYEEKDFTVQQLIDYVSKELEHGNNESLSRH